MSIRCLLFLCSDNLPKKLRLNFAILLPNVLDLECAVEPADDELNFTLHLEISQHLNLIDYRY